MATVEALSTIFASLQSLHSLYVYAEQISKSDAEIREFIEEVNLVAETLGTLREVRSGMRESGASATQIMSRMNLERKSWATLDRINGDILQTLGAQTKKKQNRRFRSSFRKKDAWVRYIKAEAKERHGDLRSSFTDLYASIARSLDHAEEMKRFRELEKSNRELSEAVESVKEKLDKITSI